MKTLLNTTLVATLSFCSMSTAMAKGEIPENQYYFSADYGFVSTNIHAKNVTVYNNDKDFSPVQLTIGTPKANTQFFSIGAGSQNFFTPSLGFRIGPEYDYFSTKYQGSQKDYSGMDNLLNGSYSYEQSVQALFLSGKLLFKPFTKSSLLAYFGAKAGLAYNQTGTYSFTPADPDNNDGKFSYTSNTNNGFAYGWNLGLEYIFAQRVGVHAGFEQINFGATPPLTDGTWRAYGFAGTMSDLGPNTGTINVMNMGLTVLF